MEMFSGFFIISIRSYYGGSDWASAVGLGVFSFTWIPPRAISIYCRDNLQLNLDP